MAIITKRIHDHQRFYSIVIPVVFLMYLFFPNSEGFQYFKLVQQWPKSYCEPVPSICKRDPLPENFTIHGLWPENLRRSLIKCPLTFTLTNLPLDPASLLRLDASWTDLKNPFTGGQAQEFWIKQYKKHGSCTFPTYSVENYFLKALELKDRFDILKIIQHDGLDPRIDYDRHKFKDAINQATGAMPILKCKGDNLNEIIICFDSKGTTVVACRGSPYRGCNYKIKYP